MTATTLFSQPGSSLLDNAVLSAIRFYRSKLSPKKGFVCAAGVAGHETCSTEIRNLVRDRGALAAVAPALGQFALCARSAWALAGADRLERFQRNPRAGKISRGNTPLGPGSFGGGSWRGSTGRAGNAGSFNARGGTFGGGNGFFPMGGGRPMGGGYTRRSSGPRVQGMCCCGPIPIPFAF